MEMGKFRFLVVDDSEMICQFVSQLLRGMGVTNIKAASDGESALVELHGALDAGTPYHVVILDWEMPKKSGYDLLVELRADNRFNETGFIMCSTVSDETRIRRIAQLKPNAYIVKPFTPQAFQARVEALVREIEQKTSGG
ncbi:MAG: response regulator [Bdellovibrionales bacterium]|nr:response regulator [Bdellovibrionales bacterium]